MSTPDNDEVAVDGVPVQVDTSRRYVILNKPTGIVSSLQDERGRRDLSEFVDRYQERLFNVGRLDAETSGLIVLTNDGDLAHVLAHPSFGVTKTYVAKVRGNVNPATVQRLLDGVELEDGPIAADKVRLLESSRGESLVEVTLHSGRNRIVRRMFDEVDHPVLELVRRSFGRCTSVRCPSGRRASCRPSNSASCCASPARPRLLHRTRIVTAVHRVPATRRPPTDDR